MGLTGIGKEFPISLGADAVTAAFVIGFVNIGSGMGHLAGGAILDKLGRAKTMFIIAALFSVGVCAMALSVVTRSIPVQIAGCLVCGIS
ncbi:MFS transporter [uncultured Parolsenella sp.]|uniref:MFS transporter n=1 Tax=uncultured Parolsenella sp. TaxID=2083008 RepID=UPI0026012663|nr:MFS transporter [uncultured Parolsenella sp.]